MYIKKYLIGSNDVDQFLELKLPSFFKMMQDAATEHAEEFNIGKANTIDKGLYWVITRIEIDIIDMPKYLQTVTMKTYPGDDMRFIFPRYFQLEDEKGKVLIKASSTWMVLSHETHRICLNPFPGFKSPTEHMDGEQPLPAKCQTGERIIHGNLQTECHREQRTHLHRDGCTVRWRFGRRDFLEREHEVLHEHGNRRCRRADRKERRIRRSHIRVN